jgi:SAM-dependent methyltransferase
MSTLFAILKQGYHLIPPSIRSAGPVYRLARQTMETIGDEKDLYSPKYYQTVVEPYARRSVPHMARSIVETFQPRSVIDIGCGSGSLLVALRKLGVRRLLGVDAAEAGLDMAQARGLDVHRFNIVTNRWSGKEKFDVATSMETAEHLPAVAADVYIELLCSLAPIVIFTAANHGQGGVGHLNEQPLGYWINLFKTHGFQPLEKTVAAWQPVWHAAGVADFYTRNLMIFQRS